MHFNRRLIGSAAACLVLAGCTSGMSTDIDNGDAAIALRTAAEKTLGADSFHAQSTFQIPSSSGTGTVDYQAPDREHLRWGTGEELNETISIGDTLYITALRRPGHFWMIDGHGNGATDSLMYLRYLEEAENVRLDGHQYRFDLPPNPAGPGEGTTSGVATLTDSGLINTLLYHFQLAGDDVTVRFTYNAYNSGITVEPPPPDLIVKQPGVVGCPNSTQPASGGLPTGTDICGALSPSPSP
jgi:hypothetical protein